MALQKRWPIEFFRLTDGSEPVRTWLDDLSEEVRGKVLARVDLMAEHARVEQHNQRLERQKRKRDPEKKG